MSDDTAQRPGFTLAEVMVAMVLLTFGLLAMASATGVFFTQIRSADASVERTAAIEQAVELLRAQPYDSIASTTEANARSLGGYQVWWQVASSGSQLVRVRIYARGRGYDGASGWSSTQIDSFSISIARGLQPVD